MRFAGQYYDQETGLHYNYQRYYVPEIGKYTSTDPMGLVIGPNLYTYLWGNPVNAIDPLGLWGCNADGNIDPNKTPASPNEGAAAWAQYMYEKQDKLDVDFYLKNRNADKNNSKGYWRCNIFVWDAYKKGGEVPSAKIPNHPGTRWPAYANDIGDPKFKPEVLPMVDNWRDLKAGDLVAWPNQGDSGHTGIIGCDGKIYNARSDTIDRWHPVFGFHSIKYRLPWVNRPPVYRRPNF